MKQGGVLITAVMALVLICTPGPGHARTPEMESGLNYLASTQNAGGFWNSASSATDPYTATAEVIGALQLVNATSCDLTGAVTWLSTQELDATDQLSRRILALSSPGTDLDMLLSSADGLYSAWGGYEDYDINILDTAQALRALRALDYRDTDVLSSAVSYLVSLQQSGGGWSFYLGGPSDTYMTALVSIALQKVASDAVIDTAVKKATEYLLRHQNPDGGFGSSPSTAFDTALSYEAVLGVITDETVLERAAGYLKTTQQENGSWDGDPFSTALALRALQMFEEKPARPQAPTACTVTGRVVDAQSLLPLGGVLVGISGDEATLTDETGAFTLAELQPGSYSLSFALQGYETATIVADVTQGSTVDVGTVALAMNPTTGVIRGTVTDGATGLPVEGAAIAVSGSYTATALTDEDGTFAIADVTTGDVNITVSKDGYHPASVTGTMVEGGTLIFSPGLTLEPSTDTAGRLTGRVLDGSTGEPVADADIILSGAIPGSADTGGVFIIEGLSPGSYEAVVSALGYAEQKYQVLIGGGMTTDMQDVYLIPQAASSSVKGVVRDAATGHPIEGAEISVMGAGLSAETSADGSYSIEGIGVHEIYLKASAVGYNSVVYKLVTTDFGTYRVDFDLYLSLLGERVKVASVHVAKPSYEAYEEVAVTATVENVDETVVDVLALMVVLNSRGDVVARVASEDPDIPVAPSETVQAMIKWNTGQFAPGDYRVVVQMLEAGSVNHENTRGNLLAERGGRFTIIPTLMLGGSISLSPPVTVAGMEEEVAVRAAVRNIGNETMRDFGLRLEVSKDGEAVYLKEASLEELKVNIVQEFALGAFEPHQNGDYLITLKPLKDDIASDINKEFYVGENASAVFTIDPDRAPAGDVKVAGRIHVTGSGSLAAIEQDPLLPIVRDAIQRGVDFEQEELYRWHVTNNCNGCHTQSQGYVGLEYAKDIVEVEEEVTDMIFNAFAMWQLPGGYIYSDNYGYYKKNNTVLGLWALSSSRDREAAKPYIVKAADYLLPHQETDGSWKTDYAHSDEYRCWWFHDVSFTSLAVWGISEAYRLTDDAKYIAPLREAALYLIGASDELPPEENMVRAHLITGLMKLEDIVDGEDLLQSLHETVDDSVEILKINQLYGGWRRDLRRGLDSLVTAQVLYALLSAGVSADETFIRSAINFLLNSQTEDGSWDSESGILTTNLSATSWVIISLPLAFEKLRGIDAEVHLELPANVTLESSYPYHTEAGTGSYAWKLAGVGETGKEIKLDLEVHGLAQAEIRKVAEKAYVSFLNPRTGSSVISEIRIPNIRGRAPVIVDVATDKTGYNAYEDSTITVEVSNISTAVKDVALKLVIEDAAGNEVSHMTTLPLDGLEPMGLEDWAYRMPADVTATRPEKDAFAKMDVDFAQVFADLGVPDKNIDQNSIRVLEFDAEGNVIGEKQAVISFLTGTACKVVWLVDGITEKDATRRFFIYFDSMENGEKPAPNDMELEESGGFVLFKDAGNRYYVTHSRGDGAFEIPKRVYLNSEWRWGLINDRGFPAIEDFNNDGFYDVVSSYDDGVISYYRNTKDGTDTFETGKIVGSIYSYSPARVAAGDFNNDGNEDFVASVRMSGGGIYLFAGRGDGTFYPMKYIAGPVRNNGIYKSMVAIDVDSDGNLDLITHVDWWPYYLKGHGDGTFSAPVIIENILAEAFTAGDFDGDGNIDIIQNTYGNNHFTKGHGDGTFGPSVYIPSLQTDRYPSYGTGDFNNDGFLDVIADDVRSIEYFPGNGDGTFGKKTRIATTIDSPRSISVTPPPSEFNPLPGAPEEVPVYTYEFTWNTQNTYAGEYKVRAVILHEEKSMDESYALFDIVPEVNIESKIYTDKISYVSNETVTISATASSLSRNHNLENLTARITILDPGGLSVYVENSDIQSLFAGQLVDIKAYWETTASPKGAYTVTLEVLSGTLLLSTSTGGFDVLGSSQTGEGILGSITAEPEVVKKGADVTLLYAITNRGNEDITGLAVKVLVVNPTTQAVEQTPETAIDLPRGTTVTGILVQSTSGLSPEAYLAILQVSTPQMAEPRALAGDTFEVESPTVEVTKAVVNVKNVLIWLNYNWQSGRGCPEVSLVESALRAAGVNYRIVHYRKDFQAELRNPLYTDYMILGDHHPLEDHYAASLKEKVFSGRGLISAMFNRHNLDADVFGVKFRGYLNHGDYPVELAESDISSEYDFETLGRALRVEAIYPAENIGWIVQTTRKDTETHPALIRRSYGLGNVLFYAFDLGLSTGDYERFESLVVNSLNYIHGARDSEGEFYPYQLVPVEVRLKSLGEALDVRVKETYPPEFSLLDPETRQWIMENPWVVDIHLGAEETEGIHFYALTPDLTGTFTLTSEVGYVEDGTYNHILDSDLELSVKSIDEMSVEVLEALNSLSVSTEEEALVLDAIMYVQNVQNKAILTKADIDGNITDILQAVDSLLKLTSADASDIVLMLDDLLGAWEGRWYFEE